MTARFTTTPAMARKFFDLLKKSQRILLVAPQAPDGDSIGSQICLREIIRAHFPKKNVWMYHEDPVSDRFSILKGVDLCLHKSNIESKVRLNQIDLCVVLDGGHERVGDFLLSQIPTHVPWIQVDHHAVDGGFPYALKWWNPKAAATGELLYKLLQMKPFRISKLNRSMSEAIYVSLIFDTGFFRHDCTTAETMEIVSHLYRQKIRFTQLAEATMLMGRVPSKHLLGAALRTLEFHANGRLATAQITREDLRSHDAIEDDKDGIIDHVFLTRGVEIGVLFFGMDAQKTKVSFRSRTAFDVAQFARSLTERGGGHKKAAGCTLSVSLAEAKPLVTDRLIQALSHT